MATQHIYLKVVRRRLRLLTVCLAVAAAAGFTAPMVDAGDILVGTGSEDGFSNFVGRAICRILNRSLPDMNARAIPAETRTYNLTNLNGGSLDLALVDLRQLHDAKKHLGHFAFLDIRYDNVGVLFPLYQQPILLIVRADAGINTLADLKGKRINAGVARSETREAVEAIFAAKGWTRSDFQVVQALPASQGQESMAFCHGSIEAMVHVGVHPDSALEQLINLCGAVPVDLRDDDMLRWIDSHPVFSMSTLAAGTYPGLDKPVTGFGTTILLAASGSLDEETTLAILAALERNQANLKSIHPSLDQLSVKAWRGSELGIDLHPGAVAYFSAQGN